MAARFDGGALSSDAGLLALREVERRLDVAGRLAACVDDPRDPDPHRAQRRGHPALPDADDRGGLRGRHRRQCPARRPGVQDGAGALPGERDLCSQSTVSRLENLPDRRMLLRMGRAMVGLYCASFAQVPKRITLDIDDTFDAVHGGQQLRLFNAHYDDYGFQPIVVFDGAGRFVAAVLRPAKRPKGREIAAHLRRLIRAIRAHWPRVEILLRGDGHYCAPEVLDLCRAKGVDFVFGLPTTSVLRRHVATLEASTTARARGRRRRHRPPVQGIPRRRRTPGAASSASSPASRPGRGAATPASSSPASPGGTGKVIYENLYCARGQAENHIKAWKTHLAADRTSCTSAAANQLRLFLHAGAYWLMWTLRAALPRRSPWRRAQFDTLRLRLIKIAARVVEMKTQIRLHMPTACPDQRILRIALSRIPRLVT